MPYKSRAESAELQILRILNFRMDLSDKERQHFFNLKKGYKGEVMLDASTEKLQCDCYILNDLWFKQNNTTFQIDSLIITSGTIYFFEIKNFEGDYYYESDRFYKNPKTEITNPLNQLGRSELLIRQLIQSLGFNIPIAASVVFINPEFTLYQAPLNKPIILPTQLNRYLNKLESIPSKLNGKHKILADQLISKHIEEPLYNSVPSFDYDQLRKGIVCAKCSSFSILIIGKDCLCKNCNHKESVSTAVIRSVSEFKRLFPSRKITTNAIHEWCKVVNSKKTIRRILHKNFKTVSEHRWTFYE